METIKAFWASLVEKIGMDWAIAVAVAAVLFLIEPVLGVIAAVGFVLYKTGKLDKLIAKFKSKVE